MKSFLGPPTNHSSIYILISDHLTLRLRVYIPFSTPFWNHCVLFCLQGFWWYHKHFFFTDTFPATVLRGESNEMMNLWNNRRVTMMNFVVSLRLIALSTRGTLQMSSNGQSHCGICGLMHRFNAWEVGEGQNTGSKYFSHDEGLFGTDYLAFSSKNANSINHLSELIALLD